jgi:hypothetical protein
LRFRRATFQAIFTLSICTAMIMLSQQHASLRVHQGAHFGAVVFLILISWLVAGISQRNPRRFVAPLLTTFVGLGCLLVGKIWLSSNVATTTMAEQQKLKTLSQATMLYAGDHSETLPPAKVWMDAISTRVTEEDFMLGKHQIPPRDGYRVAMNSNLSSKSLSKIDSLDNSFVYFLSYKSERNANDAFDSITEIRQGVTLSESFTRVP